MTNWQKQVNSQLRLTPLFQPILVDYQSNFRYRVEEKGSTETRQDMAITAPLGTQAAPPLISVFWQPHHCRYACDSCWEKPLETPTNQAPQTPHPDRSETAEEIQAQAGNARTRFLRQHEGPVLTTSPGTWWNKGYEDIPIHDSAQDLSHVGCFSLPSFPTIPKEGSHSHHTAFKLAQSPTNSSFFLCSNFS